MDHEPAQQSIHNARADQALLDIYVENTG